jgi:hypothetical protein
VTLAAALVLLASCGGSSGGGHAAQLGSTATSTGTSSTAAPTSAQGEAVAFAGCMRSRGVRTWPDPIPNSNGRFDKSKLGSQQLGVSETQLQTARSACQHLLPKPGGPADQTQLQQMKAQALRFSQCVRAHGVSNFPDPDSTGRIPDPASVGIDQGSPAFQAANQACGKDRPPYIPSNSAYLSWARTHTGS